MPFRLKQVLRELGWLDRIFLVLLALWIFARLGAADDLLQVFLFIPVFALGIAVAIKWILKKAIWRLRYRLVVAYLFIAVVPLVLIFFLVWLSAYILTGQLAVYMVTSELERQTSDLLAPARSLAWTPPDMRTDRAQWVVPTFWQRFPGLEILIRDEGVWHFPADSKLGPPPPGWGDVSGLVRKDGRLYFWAHAIHDSTEVVMMAPVTQHTLDHVMPVVGDIGLLRPRQGREEIPGGGSPQASRVPPPEGFYDTEVGYPAPLPVAVWQSPGTYDTYRLLLSTRISSVVRTIFGQKFEFSEGATGATLISALFLVVVAVLLLAELASVVIGVRLTRTITAAVHSLYVATMRVRQGIFSHRIEVHGSDQLAELSESFNSMTANIEELLQVAKEKERLQSELEIAREVQNQLFPKTVPVSNTLRLAATCRPARLVSGDYYDYLNLDEPNLAFAIGDVAGKGISAALLMATVQSTMRTQLRAGRELAMAVGNGSQSQLLSTASLVGRLNQQLFAFTPPEKFATFFFSVYDESTGLLRYTNAGHLPPILVRDGTAMRLDVTGTVVGAFSFAQYGESSIELQKGDLLVGFTDGITEPENEFGEMFGEDRLTDLLVKNAGRDSEDIIATVLEAVNQWTGSPDLQDDMTLLLARRI